MAVLRGLHPSEARRCAAETESIVWAMIVILLGVIAITTLLFVLTIAGSSGI